MAHITVPDQSPFVDFAVTTSTSDFAFAFTFFDKTDLRVLVGGVELDQEQFEVVGTGGYEGGYPGGTVTLDTAAANTTVTLWSEMPPSRINDFNEGAGLPARAVNTELDRATARLRDMRLRLQRTPTLTVTLDTELTAGDAGQIFTNGGVGDVLTYTLPQASPGLGFIFAVISPDLMTVAAHGADTISDAGTESATLESDAVGSIMELRCAETGTWLVSAMNGTWS